MFYDEKTPQQRESTMMRRQAAIYFLFIIVSLGGCAVMPPEVTDDAISGVPFRTLVKDAAGYRGQAVILGGYIVEVANEADRSRIIAVQTELGGNQRPKSRDLSRGRLVISYRGFIDPEVYRKDRKITVAGKIVGSSQTERGKFAFPYLHIEMTHIHLWPEEKVVPYDPYRDDWGPPYFYHPWFWGRPYHPYWW
jgi:outer membrane lipoprotein